MYIIRRAVVRLADDSDITDEKADLVLHVDGKILSLRDRLILRDPSGREVAQVHRKLAALGPTYQITVDGKTVAAVRKHLFSTFRERFTIDIAGAGPMEMTGDLLSHEFTIQRDRPDLCDRLQALDQPDRHLCGRHTPGRERPAHPGQRPRAGPGHGRRKPPFVISAGLDQGSEAPGQA